MNGTDLGVAAQVSLSKFVKYGDLVAFETSALSFMGMEGYVTCCFACAVGTVALATCLSTWCLRI